MSDSAFIASCRDKVLAGDRITMDEAETLLATDDVMTLADSANTITRKFNGDVVDVEALINAKSGKCPEDCSFCAQSTFYETGVNKYPLLPAEQIVENAWMAKEGGATSFCLVCAYRSPPEKDFEQICDTITAVKKEVGTEVNVSLGFMTPERAKRLKALGVKR